MLKPLALALIGSLLVLPAAKVRADVYRWVDQQGTLHFAQDLSRVPAEHREMSRAPAGAPRGDVRAAPAAPGATRAVRVSYEDDSNLIRVMVRINDKVTAPFYVDTGSTELVVPRALAQKLAEHGAMQQARGKLETAVGTIDVPLLRLTSVRLGDAEVEDVWAAVAPELEVGLLGGAFLNQFVYSIDPETRVLSLMPRARS
jgi:clan AA aspartic protease (TIGR02281 family)